MWMPARSRSFAASVTAWLYSRNIPSISFWDCLSAGSSGFTYVTRLAASLASFATSSAPISPLRKPSDHIESASMFVLAVWMKRLSTAEQE